MKTMAAIISLLTPAFASAADCMVCHWNEVDQPRFCETITCLPGTSCVCDAGSPSCPAGEIPTYIAPDYDHNLGCYDPDNGFCGDDACTPEERDGVITCSADCSCREESFYPSSCSGGTGKRLVKGANTVMCWWCPGVDDNDSYSYINRCVTAWGQCI